MADNDFVFRVVGDQASINALRRQIESQLSKSSVNLSVKGLDKLQFNSNDLRNASGGLAQLSGSFNDVAKSQSRVVETTNAVSNSMKQQSRDTKQAAKDQEVLSERIGQTTRRLVAYLVPAASIFQITRGLGAARQSITQIDAELNKLTQILDGNRDASSQAGSEALKLAEKYGQSGLEILKTTNILAQAGSKFGGNAKTLINVTDQLTRTKLAATFGEVEETTQGLIAALSQFNLSAADTNRILDVTNELSKKYSVESRDLFEAVRSGGAAFALTGGNIEDFNSVVTGLIEKTKLGASVVGTGINTIALRSLRPEAIKYVEDITAGVGGIRDQNGALLSLVDQWRQLAKATQGYTQEQLGPLIETLAGIRQGKLFVPLLDLFRSGQIDQIFDTARTSAGSFNKDTAIGLERIDVQLGSVGARFDQVFKSFAEDQGIRRLFSDFATLAKSLASVLEVLQPVIPLLARLAAIRLGIGLVRGIPTFVQGLRNIKNVTEDLTRPGGLSDLLNGKGRGGRTATRGLSNVTQQIPRGSSQSTLLVRQDSKDQAILQSNTTALQQQTAAVKAWTSATGNIPRGMNAWTSAVVSRQAINPRNISGRVSSLVVQQSIDRTRSNAINSLQRFDQNRIAERQQLAAQGEVARQARFANLFARPSSVPFGPITRSQFSRQGLATENEIQQDVRQRQVRQDINRQFATFSGLFGSRKPAGPENVSGFAGAFNNIGFRNERISGRASSVSVRLTQGEAQQRLLNAQVATRTQAALQQNILDLQIPKAKLIKNTNDLSNQLLKNRLVLQRTGLSETEINRSLEKLNKDLLDQSIQLARLEAAEAKLIARYNQASTAPSPATQQTPVTVATGGRIGRLGQRLSGLGGKAFRGAAPFAGDIAGIVTFAVAEQIAASQESQIHDIIVSGKPARDLQEVLRKNRSATIKSSAARGGGFGALGGASLGAQIGLAGGPLGAAIGGGVGLLVGAGLGLAGGGLSGKASVANKQIEELLEQSNSFGIGKEGTPLIANAIRQIQDRAGLNSAFDTSGTFIGGTLNGGQAFDLSSEIRKSFQGGGGEQALSAIRTRALQIAGTSKFEGDVPGAVRTQLINELGANIQEYSKSIGQNISKTEAYAQAQAYVTEGLRELDGINGELVDANKKYTSALTLQATELDKVRLSISNLGDNFTLAANRTRQLTGDINLRTGQRDIRTQGQSQLVSGLLNGRQAVQIPQQAANVITQSFLKVVRNTPRNGAGLQDRIDRFATGTFNAREREELFDAAQLSNFTQDLGKEMSARLSQVIVGPRNTANVSQAAREILRSASQGLNLRTEAGANEFARIKDAVDKIAKENPENFNSLIGEFFGNYDQTILDRFNATISDAQSRINELAVTASQYRDVQERLVQIESQAFSSSLGRAREGFRLGAGSDEIRAGIGGVISAAGPLPNLQQLSTDVLDAQRRLAGFAGQATPEAQQAQNALDQANQNYTNAVTKTQNVLQAFRARLEETTKQLSSLIDAQRTAGGQTFGQVNESRFNLGLVQSMGGGILGDLRKLGVSSTDQLSQLNPKQLQAFQNRASSFAGTDVFVNALRGSESLRGTLLPGGGGQSTGNALDLLQVLAGGSNLGRAGLGSTNTKVEELLQSQKADFSAILEAERNQLSSLSTINLSVLAVKDLIEKRLPELKTDQTTGITGPAKSVVEFQGNLNVTGIEGVGKDVATKAVVSFMMEQFAKQLDRSDPTQDTLATKIQAAIKQINSN